MSCVARSYGVFFLFFPLLFSCLTLSFVCVYLNLSFPFFVPSPIFVSTLGVFLFESWDNPFLRSQDPKYHGLGPVLTLFGSIPDS